MTSGLFTFYPICVLRYTDSFRCQTNRVISVDAMHGSYDVDGRYVDRGSPVKLEKPRIDLFRGKSLRKSNHLTLPPWTDLIVKQTKWNATRNGSTRDTDEESGSSMQTNKEESERSHLDLLRQITSNSATKTSGKTISEQLIENLDLVEDEEFSIPLGTGELEIEPLTISQKRNIRRQDYLNQVSQRNDTRFFTTVALFVLVPPVVILGVAVATGYVDLIP